MDFSLEIHSDDGDSGSEGPHGFAKFCGVQAHSFRKCYSNRLHYHAAPLYDSFNVDVIRKATVSAYERNFLVEVRPGEPISRETALELIDCADSELPDLLAAAHAAKEQFKPGVITYSRKVFIP